MAVSAIGKKLKLVGRKRAAVLNAPSGYTDSLGAEVATKLTSKFDWIQVFVKNQAELEKVAAKAAAALEPESILWFTFPKGSSKIQTDLTRDKGWDVLPKLDLKWITLVSVDDTWSAFGLRPYKKGEEKQNRR